MIKRTRNAVNFLGITLFVAAFRVLLEQLFEARIFRIGLLPVIIGVVGANLIFQFNDNEDTWPAWLIGQLFLSEVTRCLIGLVVSA